jgi:peptidoglycan/xylan/chitin deacetylase (PgdA/CDA1 family)
MRYVMAVLFALLFLALPGNHNADLDAAVPSRTVKLISLSFDDVPRGRGAFLSPNERTAKLIAALEAAGVQQAAFFVNPGQISNFGDAAGGADRIAAHVKAGHVIANHTYKHPHLSARTAEAYLAEIDQAEAWLGKQPGHRPWFRFPYLDEGGSDKVKRDAVRAGLKARGLRNGYVTVDASDWNMDQLTANAVKSGRKIDMDALRDLYVETHVEAANFSDALMVRTIDRSPAHVLLLHETDLAALFIGDLVDGLRKAGWEVVTADTAYADPLHKVVTDVPSSNGTLSEAMAWEKGIPGPRWYDRSDVKIANPLFAERVLKEKPAK